MKTLHHVEAAVDEILSHVGPRILLATPLGIGKPNQLLNALYRRAKVDPAIELTIHTALTLQRPKAKSELERRLLDPIVERVFGGYPDLEFELDRVKGRLPRNVRVLEFYFMAGKYLRNPAAQRDYISSNYTHVARDLIGRGVNVVAQQVCAGIVDGRPRLSLSCNADLSVDMAKALRAQAARGKRCCFVGQINDQLPFMYGDADVDPEEFDFVIDNPEYNTELFSTPKLPVGDAESIIGLYASTLVKDGGELQVGIGALGDAVTYALTLRHDNNARYVDLLRELEVFERFGPVLESTGDTGVFDKGLFAASEMLVDGFMYLYEAGILKRKVYDDPALSRLLNSGRIDERVTPELLDLLYSNKAIHGVLTDEDVSYLQHFGIVKSSVRFEGGMLRLPDGRSFVPDLRDPVFRSALEPFVGERLARGAVVHAAFFVGPREFYAWLRNLPEEQREAIRMRSVTRINQLYGHEEIDVLHRRDARFINTTMKVDLFGATSSDTLDDGRVVSGVGGQFNFVAMARELPGARSVIQLRSTRHHRGELRSNILYNVSMVTSPRHLRDIVITEYGIADLRGKTDEECVEAMLAIADSRFQAELMREAKRHGKLREDYAIPQHHRNNLPESYEKRLAAWRTIGLFPAYPFGSDLTVEEQVLTSALQKLEHILRRPKRLLKAALTAAAEGDASPELEPLLRRMQLDDPKTAKEVLYRRLLIAALRTT